MIHDDAHTRARRRALRAELREMDRPAKEARRDAARKARQSRAKGMTGSFGQRAPRQRDDAYLRWIRGLPCVACVVRGSSGVVERCEAAHVRSGYPEQGWRPTGMAEKPDDSRTLPLCAHDHREGPKAQHAGNERAWYQALGIYPPAICKALRAAYQNGGDGGLVVRAFARSRQS